MKKILFLFTVLFISTVSFGQEKKEIWYTWVDTRVEVEGQEVRIISNELMELTCCVSSARYRKFTGKTTQWLEKELGISLGEESPFAKTKDKGLAEKIHGDALRSASDNSSIRIVNYKEKCK